MVGRKPHPDAPRLEALLDERDHLRIQIHLADVNGSSDPEALKALKAELLAIEQKIDKHWRSANVPSRD
jgi:hypothetical protein